MGLYGKDGEQGVFFVCFEGISLLCYICMPDMLALSDVM